MSDLRHVEKPNMSNCSKAAETLVIKKIREINPSDSITKYVAKAILQRRNITLGGLPFRECFDRHNLRKGFAATKTHSHGATARAFRHARSPQRVRRGQDKFARRHSESASTRAMYAEGYVS